MTEDEWLSSIGLFALLGYANTQGWTRKIRLYSCACCRVAERLAPNDWMRDVIARAERYADGGLADSTIVRYRREAEKQWVSVSSRTPLPPEAGIYLAIQDACRLNDDGHMMLSWRRLVSRPNSLQQTSERDAEALLRPPFRDIFGNPFRAVAFDPSWRSSTAVAVARQMYESRDFTGMPVLADALQDAGCDNDDVLTHCRGDGVHVRGCWVVDLVLGKV
jgi:hypothetical protein